MRSVSVFTPFRSTQEYARARFTFTRKLIGRRGCTAIIDCFQCCVEETNFREAVSNREAQPTPVQTQYCHGHRKKAVFLSYHCQVRFMPVVQAITSSKSYRLGFQRAAEQSRLAIVKASTATTKVIFLRTVLTNNASHLQKNPCHLLSVSFCYHFVLIYFTVPQSQKWKRNINFYWPLL